MNPIRDNVYLSLDLELNTDGTQTDEICEVGIALGTPSNIFLKDSRLIKIKKPLHPRTTEITGITQEDVDGGVELQEAAEWLSNLIDTHKPFVNAVQWGVGDSFELLDEFKNTGIAFPYFGRRFIDVKHFFLFIEAANGRALSGGLRSSMGKHKLSFIGNPHRAADDAFNTLRFFFHLLQRQRKLEEMFQTAKLLSY
jgi:inhibitor of KinA sporulation pathway (predicted exonuclease)